MKNSTKLMSTAVALTALAITAGSVYAFQGDPNKPGPNFSPERHETMIRAFDNNDYESWKTQMDGRGRAAQVVNQDNFARFAEAHMLAQQGDLEGAQAIRAELGLGLKNGSGHGRQGHGKGMSQGNGKRSGAQNGTGPRAGSADCLLNQ